MLPGYTYWSSVTGLGYHKRPGWAIFPHSASLIASYQREHYKLDWHRFNLKQRLKNKPLLSALDFEKQSSTGDDWWEDMCGNKIQEWRRALV